MKILHYMVVALVGLYAFIFLLTFKLITHENKTFLNHLDDIPEDYSPAETANFMSEKVTLPNPILLSPKSDALKQLKTLNSIPETIQINTSKDVPSFFRPELERNVMRALPGYSTSIKSNLRFSPTQNHVNIDRTANNKFFLATFKTRVPEKDKNMFRKTLQTFDRAMSEAGATYFMYGGTLLGSYRHHDMIPWDDDVDVIMPLTQQRLLRDSVLKIGTHYVLHSGPVHFWKFYSSSASTIKQYKWKWPFLDIFFYDENDTHIWDVSPNFKRNYVFLKTDVFPLRRRPLMGLYLLAPHNTLAVIQNNYNIRICQSGYWNHKWEQYALQRSVPCFMLQSTFPFVHRHFVLGGCNETLQQNGEIINSFLDWGVTIC